MSDTATLKKVLPKLRETALPKPSWVMLPEHDVSICYLSVAEDPDLIFLRLTDFYDRMEKFNKDIQEYAKKHQEQSTNTCVLEVGDICLARSMDVDEWNRAVIKSKVSDDQFEVFFVDFGDLAIVSANNVLPITGELITKVPFQVIECYLAGIKFPEIQNEEWQNAFVDELSNLTKMSYDTDITLSLKVKVVGVEPEGRFSKGRRYKVVLFQSNGSEGVNLNNKLVDAGLAHSLDGEEDHLENIVEEDLAYEQPQVTFPLVGSNGTRQQLTVIDLDYNGFEFVTSRPLSRF